MHDHSLGTLVRGQETMLIMFLLPLLTSEASLTIDLKSSVQASPQRRPDTTRVSHEFRRTSLNLCLSSSNHFTFCISGLLAAISTKLGPKSTKFGMLNCLSTSSTPSGHHRGLQTRPLLPGRDCSQFTFLCCLLFMCLKRRLTSQPVFLKRERSRTLDVLPPDFAWSPASPRSCPRPDLSDIF